ncbi:MAG TPA: MerR family transcriptional regulator [candidate division Zixibacteria bacterium]|jgi:DNA-binding transcriptional MerR regulator|nr:MerR family transcriptional regulator [candidate division Zixibacteria bacterium]
MKKNEADERREGESSVLANLPTKVYYSIREVAEILEVKAYILRFWEGEFPQLHPKTSKGGRRQYQLDDIKLLLLIKRLLYREGYTIAGARARLREIRLHEPNQMDIPFDEWRKKAGLGQMILELKQVIDCLGGAK